jgi:tRNA G46 methylase TrmB
LILPAAGLEIVEAIERLFHVGYEAWVAEQWIPAVPGLQAKLDVGVEAAEVGCGAGQCIVPVAATYPNSRFTGYDVDAASIARVLRKPQAPESRIVCSSNRWPPRTFPTTTGSIL